jgi:hypothetical protein
MAIAPQSILDFRFWIIVAAHGYFDLAAGETTPVALVAPSING